MRTIGSGQAYHDRPWLPAVVPMSGTCRTSTLLTALNAVPAPVASQTLEKWWPARAAANFPSLKKGGNKLDPCTRTLLCEPPTGRPASAGGIFGGIASDSAE